MKESFVAKVCRSFHILYKHNIGRVVCPVNVDENDDDVISE
jgi:hypothetical protein